MCYLTLIVSILIQGSVEKRLPQSDRAKITVINETAATTNPYPMMRFNAGPSVEDMIDSHFFPGIDYYNAGRYVTAQLNLLYVISRPHNLKGNSRLNEFLSTSHYLLGMIYIYHADGFGRRNVAREHFEKAIEWNPTNYMAYIELARVFAELRVNKQASAVIQRLLELNPPEPVAAEARKELTRVSSTDK